MTTQAEAQELANSSDPDRSETTKKPTLAQGESQSLSALAVEFRNVHFSFDDEKVLDGVSFTVVRGEIKIILSGSGGANPQFLN